MNPHPAVCVLTAGKGTRMGNLGKSLNKALFPLKGKAIISHIIEKFPSDTEFVIALGYLGQQVRDYLEIAHSNLNFTFVSVDSYEGPGCGPGYSLLCCESILQRPFFFVACDTLWNDDLKVDVEKNWVAIAQINSNDSRYYCNLKVENGLVSTLLDKVHTEDQSFKAFTGLCFIKDVQIFLMVSECLKMILAKFKFLTE